MGVYKEGKNWKVRMKVGSVISKEKEMKSIRSIWKI